MPIVLVTAYGLLTIVQATNSVFAICFHSFDGYLLARRDRYNENTWDPLKEVRAVKIKFLTKGRLTQPEFKVARTQQFNGRDLFDMMKTIQLRFVELFFVHS